MSAASETLGLLEADSSAAKRALHAKLFEWGCMLAVVVAILPLGSLLWSLVSKGGAAISVDLFTELPVPLGEMGGGMGNGALGSLYLVGLASLMGVPVAVLSGIFLSEYGETRAGAAVRFCADVLSGIPSITVGLFVYGVVVLPMKRFSVIAGAIALAIIMLPTITRTTEEMLRLVPNQLREAALGLGVSRWRTTASILIRTALPGIVTGVSLAIARIAGETAPLLFTAFSNSNWTEYMDDPVASLPVQIYTYAVSPYSEWHSQAWGAALALVLVILVLSVAAKFATRTRYR
ncbi:MAG: hypothetical protein RJA70_1911 [Pseudomonadota bacterium]|jgi:phosphate transport system permease protein